jgi:hypothetical protein
MTPTDFEPGDRVICGEIPHAYRGVVAYVLGDAVTVFHDYPCPDWHQTWNVDRVRPEPKSEEDPDAQ